CNRPSHASPWLSHELRLARLEALSPVGMTGRLLQFGPWDAFCMTTAGMHDIGRPEVYQWRLHPSDGHPSEDEARPGSGLCYVSIKVYVADARFDSSLPFG
ncbi:MAG: hypothetical protein ACLPXB_13865, partial [Thiobacillaceae bacterium]